MKESGAVHAGTLVGGAEARDRCTVMDMADDDDREDDRKDDPDRKRDRKHPNEHPVALLKAWRAGDRDAGHQLFKILAPMLTRYFQRLVYEMSEVRGLVDDVLMTLLTVDTPFKGPPEAFRSYVLGIAYNKFREWLRRKHYGERLIDFAADAEAVAEVTIDEIGLLDPSDFVERTEERKLILKGLRRIPVDYQLIFMLSLWMELTNAEIAEALGLPIGTVASRLRLAKERLEKALKGLKADPILLQETTETLSVWLKRMQALLPKKGPGKGGADEPGDD